jgi:hypothetical protein
VRQLQTTDMAGELLGLLRELRQGGEGHVESCPEGSAGRWSALRRVGLTDERVEKRDQPRSGRSLTLGTNVGCMACVYLKSLDCISPCRVSSGPVLPNSLQPQPAG